MRAVLSIFLLAATGLIGCATEPSSGSASVYVKDAPTDEFQEIHINFTKVEVHYAGRGTEAGSEGEEGTEGEGGEEEEAAGRSRDATKMWRMLFESDGTDIDLLAASGGLAAFLGEAPMQVGQYTQIRITVDAAWGIQQDGSRVEITVSNGTVRTSRSFDVRDGGEARIIVDLDLDRSLVKQGGGGPAGLPVAQSEARWRLTPVIGSVTVDQVEDAHSGGDVHAEGEMAEVGSA